MVDDPLGRVDVEVAWEALGIARQTVIQAVCRLRRDGWRIETIPRPHAFYRARVKWYRLDERDAGRAEQIDVWGMWKTRGKSGG